MFSHSVGAAEPAAIAEAFYGLNIEPAITSKPLWQRMVGAIKSAPASYICRPGRTVGPSALCGLVVWAEGAECGVR